jgi:hypothetical protein
VTNDQTATDDQIKTQTPPQRRLDERLLQLADADLQMLRGTSAEFDPGNGDLTNSWDNEFTNSWDNSN